MTGMQWQAQIEGQDNGSQCKFTFAEGLQESTLLTFLEPKGTWSWEVSLYASEHEHWATGYGCATESKAKHMAMHLVAALLQILDGVKPHEVD